MIGADWLDRFEGLAGLSHDLRTELARGAKVTAMPAGTVVFGPGRSPENLLLVLEGTVRVQQLSESGREIVLYRVGAGESCVMTTACMIAHEDYSAEGVAETDIRAVAIPRSLFDDLLARSAEFRTFVFSTYSRRMLDLFLVIDEIAFKRMDIRLAQKLLERGGADGTVRATHQQMAAELGSAREVISRLLQEFRRRGWVHLGRGTIAVADRAALEALAASDA